VRVEEPPPAYDPAEGSPRVSFGKLQTMLAQSSATATSPLFERKVEPGQGAPRNEVGRRDREDEESGVSSDEFSDEISVNDVEVESIVGAAGPGPLTELDDSQASSSDGETV
jgi:hypothetical protein